MFNLPVRFDVKYVSDIDYECVFVLHDSYDNCCFLFVFMIIIVIQSLNY